jgi:hypothetical protein
MQEGPAAAAAGDPVPVNLATGATPFALDELSDFGHFLANVNDGRYGNPHSWIGNGATGTSGPFVGINLGATPIANIQSIAFGRSNVLSGDPCGGGVCTDRVTGLFQLQYTTVPNPDASTPDGSWLTIGSLNYGASDGPGTNYNAIWQRHRYNFDPVSATGLRLMVPTSGLGGGTAIDEIEIYDVPGDFVPPPPPPPPFNITPAAGGYSLTWDGNDGDHFSEDEMALAPINAAHIDSGATPFTSSDLGFGIHVVSAVNDGRYGNSNSWIGAQAGGDYAGVTLAGLTPVTSIAWGRDNGNNVTDACGGQCGDRSLGDYVIEYTQVPEPALAMVTGDPATGWAQIGTVNYAVQQDAVPGGGFTPFLRHEFEVSLNGQPIMASGIRLSGLAAGTAIDELEVYGVPEPSSILTILLGCVSLGLFRRRR